jgi:3-hydroxyisobutyrate dehydrogenase
LRASSLGGGSLGSHPVGATIGLIGVGRIGLPVCSNLVRAGYTVIASDRRPEREEQARAVGAAWAAGAEAVVTDADLLITVLPGSDELREVMAAASSAMRAGTTWIDMTSSSPLVGKELRARAQDRGVECLDAPVGGGVHAAEVGEMQLFVGGRAEAVERHRGLLEALGNVNHVGEHGAGYTTKLIVNLLWFCQALATGEGLLLALRAGIDLEILRGALRRSAAHSAFIDRDLDALLDGDYLRSFGLDRCCEELDAVVALAAELDVPCEISSLVARAYGRALDRYGPVDGELLAVALLEEQTGLTLRRRSQKS